MTKFPTDSRAIQSETDPPFTRHDPLGAGIALDGVYEVALSASAAMDELEAVLSDLSTLIAEAQARHGLALASIEGAINTLNEVAPSSHQQLFAGGKWVPVGWKDETMKAALLTKSSVRRHFTTRWEELIHAREARDIQGRYVASAPYTPEPSTRKEAP